MSKRFESKTVLITGSTSGLGQNAALAFAREGAKVVVAGRRIKEGAETVAMIREAGGEASFVSADVSKPSDIETMVKTCVETYGGLDCAFNNAGTDGTLFVPTADYDKATWDRVIAVNLTGVFLSMKYEIPEMLKRGGGVIVNMAAVAGLKSGRVGTAYNASKHGVIGITTTAALEYAAQGIRVNAVCPAIIRTPMSDGVFLQDEATAQRAKSLHAMGRVGEPEEVSSLVLWLCSGEASFVTGTAIPVDGGFLLK